MAEKYIPPEKKTVEQIRAEIKKRFARWDEINKHGCNDPFWSMDMSNERPIPPKVPDDFMSPTGRYPNRLERKRG